MDLITTQTIVLSLRIEVRALLITYQTSMGHENPSMTVARFERGN